MTISLSERELATVRAALRYWRDEMRPEAGPPCYPELFEDVKPLTADEIHILCERFKRRKR